MIVSTFASTSFIFEELSAQESNILFTKSDWGEGLSTRECSERFQLIQTNFEPNLDLARFKAESHPTFKKLVENKDWTLDHDGVRALRFSNHCNSDIPVFELQYKMEQTESSHTRIYVSMDYVSYDVLEISTRFVEGHYPDPIRPQPIPFHIKNWHQIQIPGEFTNSDPPIPTEMFKIPYTITNGEIKNITGSLGEIKVELSSKDEGKFALKIPRNYPHTDDDMPYPEQTLEIFTFKEPPLEEVNAHVTKSDCFYDVWIPFSGNSTIDFAFRISYLQGKGFHGDNDVPKYCFAQTVVDESRDKLSMLSAHKQLESGISPYEIFCKNDMKLVVKHDEKPACVKENTVRILWERGWVARSTSIYTKYSNEEILDRFQSKLISQDEAKEIVQEYLAKTHLKLDEQINEKDIVVTADLGYALLSKGYLSLLDIDPKTGLPTDIMPPWWEGYYKSPQWYTELQKYYLGMEYERVEDGDIFWNVGYRTCLDCIADYPIFFVDAINGKVTKTMHIDDMFTIES